MKLKGPCTTAICHSSKDHMQWHDPGIQKRRWSDLPV